MRQHVLLGDPPALSRAAHLRQIDVVLRGDARHHRRDEAEVAAPGVLGTYGSLARRRRRKRRGRDGPSGRRVGRRRLTRCADHRQQRAGAHRLALGDEDLQQDAAGRSGDFGVDLVGVDLEQRLELSHGLAGALEPARHRPFDHRLAQLRHDHIRWHAFLFPLPLSGGGPGWGWLPAIAISAPHPRPLSRLLRSRDLRPPGRGS